MAISIKLMALLLVLLMAVLSQDPSATASSPSDEGDIQQDTYQEEEPLTEDAVAAELAKIPYTNAELAAMTLQERMAATQKYSDLLVEKMRKNVDAIRQAYMDQFKGGVMQNPQKIYLSFDPMDPSNNKK